MFWGDGDRALGADLNGVAGKELEVALKADGLDFRFIEVDVSSATSIDGLAVVAKSEFGVVDVLHNNAGIMGKPILETTEEEWAFVEKVSSRCIFLATKAFVSLMTGRKGSIINGSSIGGVTAFANMGAYGATKAAAAHFSGVAVVDLASDMRVDAICPRWPGEVVSRSRCSAPSGHDRRGHQHRGRLLDQVSSAEAALRATRWLCRAADARPNPPTASVTRSEP